jgi:hypothetical protein
MRRCTRLAFFMAVEASYAGLGYRADRLEAKGDWRVFHLILNTSAPFVISKFPIQVKYYFDLLMTHIKPQLLTL